MAPSGLTDEAAGVMPTMPATSPDATPRVVGCLARTCSVIIHARAPHRAATTVFRAATPAVLPAATAEPALKPIQPANSIPAPRKVRGTLCGRLTVGNPARRPSTSTRASVAMPALMWMAVPPARSIAPRPLAIHPPTTEPSSESNANTQWATGKKTSRGHTRAKTSQVENFIRSATPPATSATVMPANSRRNPANRAGGSPGVSGSAMIPLSPRYSRGSPRSPSPPSELPKVREYPTTTHSTAITATAPIVIIIMLSVLRMLTMPP